MIELSKVGEEEIIMIEEIIEKFLQSIENKIIALDMEYNSINEQIEDYHYSKDLLELLNISKVAFMKGILSRTKDEHQKLEEFLKKIISLNEIDNLFDSLKNLYYLSEYNLIEKNIPQMKDIELVLNNLKESIQNFQESIHEDELRMKQEKISEEMNAIMEIGSSFTEEGLESDIKDIDAFENLLEGSNLSSEEKEHFLLHILERSSIIYKETIESKTEIEQKDIEEKQEIKMGTITIEDMLNENKEKEEEQIKRR